MYLYVYTNTEWLVIKKKSGLIEKSALYIDLERISQQTMRADN